MLKFGDVASEGRIYSNDPEKQQRRMKGKEIGLWYQITDLKDPLCVNFYCIF